MTQPALWIHGDCLSPENPAFKAHPGAPAVWVWDDALLKEWRISLKRIVFMYESLLELPVVIRRGSPLETLIAFADAHGTKTIITTESPSPRFVLIVQALLKRGYDVELLEVEPFLAYDGHIDLKRFSRYWRIAERHVYR